MIGCKTPPWTCTGMGSIEATRKHAQYCGTQYATRLRPECFAS